MGIALTLKSIYAVPTYFHQFIIQYPLRMITNQLLQHFASLPVESLSNLNALEMKALLSHFHSQLQPQNSPHNNKIKTIRKVSSKPAYKRYIRSNVRRFIDRAVNQIHKQKQIVQGEVQSREKSRNSGHLNNKNSSRLQRKRKLNNFVHHMGSSLQQSSNDDLVCPICLEILVCPTLTICGHVFCFQCLDESLLFSNACPNCRENIKGFELISCPLLQSIIDKKCESVTNSQQDSQFPYSQRKGRFMEWKQRRCLNYDSLAVGQAVDAKDPENIWCQGSILSIYWKVDRSTSKNKISSVLLHYNRWHKIYNEVIDVPTNRLAPLNCFSSRTEIPRYQLSEEDDNMRGTVISGTRVQQNGGMFIQIASEQEEEEGSEGQSLQQIEEEEQNLQIEESERESSPHYPMHVNIMDMFRNNTFMNFPFNRPFWNQPMNQLEIIESNELSNSVLQIEQMPQVPIVFNEQSNHYLYRRGNHYEEQEYHDFSSASVRQVSNDGQIGNVVVLDCESSERKQNSFIEIKDSNEEQKENESEDNPKIMASIRELPG